MSDRNEQVAFPYEIRDIDVDTTTDTKLEFTIDDQKYGYVEVSADKYVLPPFYRELAQQLWNFKSRPDDIWVTTYPRSGTTWTQEMVWLIVNDSNYEKAAQRLLLDRFPHFDQGVLNKKYHITNAQWAERTDRRLIKTHFPFSLMPPSVMKSGAKIIYVARNPKDVVVSKYHLARSLGFSKYTGNFDTFCELFVNDKTVYSPYWKHINEGWHHRNHANVLFIFYEDMINDLRGAIRKVAAFCDKSLTETEVNRLYNHLRFDKFKHNASVNRIYATAKQKASANTIDATKLFELTGEGKFVRKGKSSFGDWPLEFTAENRTRFERWMATNLAETDMRFPDSDGESR